MVHLHDNLLTLSWFVRSNRNGCKERIWHLWRPKKVQQIAITIPRLSAIVAKRCQTCDRLAQCTLRYITIDVDALQERPVILDGLRSKALNVDSRYVTIRPSVDKFTCKSRVETSFEKVLSHSMLNSFGRFVQLLMQQIGGSPTLPPTTSRTCPSQFFSISSRGRRCHVHMAEPKCLELRVDVTEHTQK